MPTQIWNTAKKKGNPDDRYLEMMYVSPYKWEEGAWETSTMGSDCGGPLIDRKWVKNTDARFAGPLKPPEEE